MPPRDGAGRVGGWPRDRGSAIGTGQGQPATAGGPPGGAADGGPDSGGFARGRTVHGGGAAAACFPPLFNRYGPGQSFGTHVDNAVRQSKGIGHRIRTDLSATLFFTHPEEYDGGELVIEDTYGAHSVKLPAGHMVLYPSTSLHHVTPVTRGARVCSFFWIQSMVRDDGERWLLFDLDMAVQRLNQESRDSEVAVRLTGVYHNLLRRWAEI